MPPLAQQEKYEIGHGPSNAESERANVEVGGLGTVGVAAEFVGRVDGN